MVGYTGGENEAATYQSVCRGDGHTEGIRLWYDENEVTYGELLAKFFKEHDVSSLNFVRPVKAQYKSGIWYHTPEQKEEASAAIAQLQAQGRKVGTTLDPVGLWVDAEEYHQKYHEKILARQSANL